MFVIKNYKFYFDVVILYIKNKYIKQKMIITVNM